MVSEQMKKELQAEQSESRSEGSAATSEKKKKDKKKKKKKLEAGASTDAKIADIQFSFKNHKLIEELRTRGAAIAANKYDEVRDQDEVINKLINEDFDKLSIPTSAFITFESDDAQIAAINIDGAEKALLGMDEIKFEEASEPTDIIWENRRFTLNDYWKRNGVAYSTITVMLIISGIIIYCISQYAAAVQKTFPAVNCDQLIDAYGDVLETAAVQDFNYIKDNKRAQSSGCLQCYCQQ